MAYLEGFQKQLENRDFQNFMHLWEEYCSSDEVDAEELKKILLAVKNSDFAPTFGKHIDSALALWSHIQDENKSFEVFKLIVDLQTTGSAELAQMIQELLKKRFGDTSQFNEKLRIVGLKGKNFQGAVRNFELLCHLNEGKFVFHAGGWGTGEVVDVSLLREEVVLEFDKVSGKRSLSFANAFKCLVPLADDHFLARRFGDPDALEVEARKDPAAVIRLLLSDLGPKTASEIKDELADWVIPEEEWTKWWSSARTKIKKDTLIEVPENMKEPFHLRAEGVSHEERFLKAIEKESDINKAIETLYSFMRDYAELQKSPLVSRYIHNFLQDNRLQPSQKVQFYLLLEDLGEEQRAGAYIKDLQHVQSVVQEVHVGALKKRVLVYAKEVRDDYEEIFLDLLFTLPMHSMRDYLTKELAQGKNAEALKQKLHFLLQHPSTNPELFVWYFQKITSEEGLPFATKEGRLLFLESLLMLLSQIEEQSRYKDLVKKIHNIISDNRFAIIRSLLEGTTVAFISEFLLLVTKCRSFSDHDSKILHSLAYVVHPSLAKKKEGEEPAFEVIWTTKEGFQKVQARIQQIGTVETVENAKEIEVARSHGDLRENAEYKFALEKRSRLQAELKLLTNQVNRARIITAQDITTNEVGAGSVVQLQNSKGENSTYTLLGPWDANPEKNILSLQSKFAQAMTGLKVGESFKFQDDEYKVTGIKNYL